MKKENIFNLLILAQFFLYFSPAYSLGREPSKVTKPTKTAIFGTGCFWCSQADIEKIEGVKSALPGYSGGTFKSPTYKNHPGHIEVVKITYDPLKVSYLNLVKKVWLQQIPTDGGGSFCDRGYSYRNVFFYENEDEERNLKNTKATLEKILGQKIKTIIKERTFFTLAEKYHIDYARKNPFRYKYYRYGCGRDKALKLFWDRKKIKRGLKNW